MLGDKFPLLEMPVYTTTSELKPPMQLCFGHHANAGNEINKNKKKKRISVCFGKEQPIKSCLLGAACLDHRKVMGCVSVALWNDFFHRAEHVAENKN